MWKKSTALFIFCLLLIAPQAAGQYHYPGSAPTTVFWKQLKGEHFTVIYPREIDSLAREYLYSFERTRDATLTGLHIDAPRMPMILQPYNMYSNGNVSWAPRRIELYTTPPGTPLYALDWVDQLALHEGRHVGQFAHYNKGNLRPLFIIFGEQAFVMGFPSTTQNEGDAVSNETDLSAAGRGRDPEFLKYYRAAFLAGDIRAYDNWRYGSYRRYTPNKYAFGYMINSTMRDNSGNYFVMGDVLQEKVHSWWRFFSVSNRSSILASGLTTRKNWREAVARYNSMWSWDYYLRMPYSPSESVLKGHSKYYLEFTNPLPVDDKVYVTMSGLPFEKHLGRIDSLGRYRYVRPFSANASTLVKESDHTFIFSEIVPDPRWEMRSWSVIRRYDTRNGRMKTLTRRTRYVNPSVAPDGSILAVEYLVKGGSAAVVLEPDGKLRETFPAPEGGQLVNLVQLGQVRYATVVTKEGEGIYRHDDSTWTRVVPPQSRMIRDLRSVGDSLLCFVSDLDGLSNIYAFDPGTGRLLRWVNAPHGTAQPWLDEATGTLYYADYSHEGYRPVRLPLARKDRKPASFEHPYILNRVADRNANQVPLYVKPRTEAEDQELRSQIDSLPARHYSKLLHGFHIHSWAPLYVNIDRIMNDLSGLDISHLERLYEYVAPGVTIMSQNEMGTLATVLGYSYHKRHHGAHAYVKYTGLYPVIETAFDFNERSRTFQYNDMRHHDKPGVPVARLDTLSKAAINFNLRLSVPLHFSKGGWATTVEPHLSYAMTNDGYLFVTPDSRFIGSNYSRVLNADLLIDSRLARPTSRLTPRLGFGLQLTAQTRIGPAEIRNPVGALRAYTYLPGFRVEDGFKLTYAYQHQPEGGLFFSPAFNLVRRPYGYDNMILMNYHRLLAEYAMPIYAGDLNGGWFFYLKRVLLIPFVDAARDTRAPVYSGNDIIGFAPQNYLSYGTKLMLNTYLFRIGTELKFGIQYTRVYGSPKWGSIRFVLSTGL